MHVNLRMDKYVAMGNIGGEMQWSMMDSGLWTKGNFLGIYAGNGRFLWKGC